MKSSRKITRLIAATIATVGLAVAGIGVVGSTHSSGAASASGQHRDSGW